MIIPRRWHRLAVAALLAGDLAWLAGAGRAADAGLFADDAVRRISIEMTPAEMESLRQESRGYVRATVREAGETYREVGLHLKGEASFRILDDKPALTLSFGKFKAGQSFHGLSKIHLNNSVEDPSYLSEKIGSELFRAAGVPAPRVAHALVELNGRKLGFYVLKEGFTPDFLRLYFQQTHGNLYDIGDGHEITDAMERNSGDGPDNRADLPNNGWSTWSPTAATQNRTYRLAYTLNAATPDAQEGNSSTATFQWEAISP